MENFFRIGKIVNTQGNKGEIRIMPSTDDITRFERLETVLIKFKNNKRTLTINNVRYHKSFVVIKFAEILNMNDAEDIKNYELFVSKDEAIPLDDDEFYYSDIYDSEVFTEEGEYLGIVSEIIETGANDVYLIKKENTKDLLIPAIDECIKKIDVTNKKIIIHLMEGLR